MKLWLISQKVNNDYDTYDSAIVAAETEDAAKNMRPNGTEFTDAESLFTDAESLFFSSWCELKDVEIEYLGNAAKHIKRGVILASYRAG